MITIKKQEYTFTLNEIEKLDDELSGVKNYNNERVTTGLLEMETDLKLKFLLDQLDKTIQPYRTKSIEYRDKLITKLGTPNTSGIPEIPIYLVERQGEQDVQTPNPVYDKFQEDYNKYLNKKVTFKTLPIDLDLLERVVTSEKYPMLFAVLAQQFEEVEEE
jgi:hypothetical protein